VQFFLLGPGLPGCFFVRVGARAPPRRV
jgi:hypothetical protein